MIEIQLTQERTAIIDDIDSDLNQFNWYAAFHPKYGNGGNYTARRKYRKGICVHTEQMHRTILSRILNRPLERYEEVDHENRNPLDNRRQNLRLATREQNTRNQGAHKDGSSNFKGVSWNKEKGKWHARIYTKGKHIHIGYFENATSAAKSYDEKAKQLFGAFAVTNFQGL